MKRTGKSAALIVAGMLIGIALGGSAAFAAGGVLAERSAMRFTVNGAPAEVTAYLIDGNNYLKLRDIAALADFGVSWDADSCTVQINTAVSYATEPNILQTAAAADYSSEADPAVFVKGYSRELYDALRESIVTGERSRTFTLSDEAMIQACRGVTAAFGIWPGYGMSTAADGTCSFAPKYSSAYETAAERCRPFIDSLAGLSDQEKVKQIAFYVCDRLTYDANSTPTPRTVFENDAEHPGNCMAYAHSFIFLCDMADIPCILIHSDVHQWNEVYFNGRWWSVDVSGFDCWEPAQRQRATVLHDTSEMQGVIFEQSDPALTRFVKELLVPGSTSG